MNAHSTRLRNGVKELIRTDETTLEDLHMVATDVISRLDKVVRRIVKKLKCGQAIRVYDEESNKEYGQRGSAISCFFKETHETKTRGTTLRVYDGKHEWSLSLDCLLNVSEDFDPESIEGKKRLQRSNTRRRGRRSKAEAVAEYTQEFDTAYFSPKEFKHEPEEDGEEYDFSSSTNWEDYYEND